MTVELVEQLPVLPPRPLDGHKGSFGRVMIIAGSVGMSGAACLSGFGALRSGAGLVTLAVPRSIAAVVATAELSWMTLPVDESDACLTSESAPHLHTFWGNQSVVAIGPGLGQAAKTMQLVHEVYQGCPHPLVLDADGLNAFRADVRLLQRTSDQPTRVLTPHLGEFSRLTGLATEEITADPRGVAVQFAAANHVVLLLKGPGTIITDGKQLAVNRTGNSGMATGGTGDVLTGLIAGLVGQGMSAFAAAQLAAHVHGLAGDLAAKKFSARAMIASDLVTCIGDAWKQLESDA